MASDCSRLCIVLAICLAGCSTTPLLERSSLPAQFAVAQRQLVLHSDFPLPEHHRLLDELVAQRADLTRQLGLPASDESINVYLFESAERFDEFMRRHHPEFPNRRAFFVETDTHLTVYAQWGDRVGEDLRHEVTHAYLHAVVPHVPLWLDEGIAEYYEVGRARRGLNRQHVTLLADRVRRGAWQPNLRRLEQRDPTQDLTQDEYAEAWAWVHFLLESRPETDALLKAYFADLRRDGHSEPISARLQRIEPAASQALVEHVRGLLPYVAAVGR